MSGKLILSKETICSLSNSEMEQAAGGTLATNMDCLIIGTVVGAAAGVLYDAGKVAGAKMKAATW